jgi:hypothetical protein
MTDLVKLYNPANASALSKEEVDGLQKLNSTQIRELAQAYPNQTMQRAYLLIIDSKLPANRQIPAMSSFENLYNLREKNGMRQYVAFAFKGNYKPTQVVTTKKNVQIVDLSDTELMHLPGFKKPIPQEGAGDMEIKVTKVKRTKKQIE